MLENDWRAVPGLAEAGDTALFISVVTALGLMPHSLQMLKNECTFFKLLEIAY